jgi:hypothetical protein
MSPEKLTSRCLAAIGDFKRVAIGGVIPAFYVDYFDPPIISRGWNWVADPFDPFNQSP